jgi:hypothetical protein
MDLNQQLQTMLWIGIYRKYPQNVNYKPQMVHMGLEKIPNWTQIGNKSSIIECVARHKPTRNHKLDTNGLQKLNYGVRTITYPDSLVSPNRISLCKKIHNKIT